MRSRRPAPTTGLAIALVAGLIALPACNKNKDTPQDTPSPPPLNQSSKGGFPMPPGSQPTAMTPTGGQNDASLPTPPPAGRAIFNVADFRSKPITQNNLKQIALAFHNVHDAYNGLPVGIADKSGKPGLSWRVALLPYLEQDNLYKMFKLDEPWDSPSNKKLIQYMPKTYSPPNTNTNGYTYYRSFSGQGAIMPPLMQPGRPGQLMLGSKLVAIADGTSNTLLAAEATEPVIWTKPDDLPFAPGKPPKLGGGVYASGFHAVLCDGSVRFVPMSVDATTLSNMIQINDGQIVNFP